MSSPPPILKEHDGQLQIHLLGLIDFDSALFLQERLVYEISGREDLNAGLLLCEHPPMITIGRDGSRDQILMEPEDLAIRQIETRWLGRGGGCFVHGPGQLVAYPVLPLKRLGQGLFDYRSRLEQTVIDMADDLQVPASRHPEFSGIWGRCGRFADVGVAVKSWVSYHGLNVDVAPYLESSQFLKSRSKEERYTSLSAQSGKLVSMNSVRESFIRHLSRQMGYSRTNVFTGHPLLHRKLQKVFVDA